MGTQDPPAESFPGVASRALPISVSGRHFLRPRPRLLGARTAESPQVCLAQGCQCDGPLMWVLSSQSSPWTPRSQAAGAPHTPGFGGETFLRGLTSLRF